MRLTAHLLSGGARLLEQRVREGLARRRLPGSAASHRAHAVVSPAAHHGHVHPVDQRGQGGRSVPHGVSSPGLWSLAEKKTRLQAAIELSTKISISGCLLGAQNSRTGRSRPGFLRGDLSDAD